jgi:pimeloyl-ACP methyl ester carboxylesterase
LPNPLFDTAAVAARPDGAASAAGSSLTEWRLVDGHTLEVVRLVPSSRSNGEHPLPTRALAGTQPTLVFLHEGIGSVSLWRDFPQQVCDRTGLPGLVYSRYGYGQSSVLARARTPDYMHHEARVVLPELLRACGIARPILVGHSDGGSIGLLHAASGEPIEALAVLAPHVFVEPESIAGIEVARDLFAQGDLKARLARHHRDPEATFRGWNDIWLSPAFRLWNIESELPSIRCPVLAIQGEDDNYGTMRQLEAIGRQTGGPYEELRLADCGHNPHRDQPVATIEAIARFVIDRVPAR